MLSHELIRDVYDALVWASAVLATAVGLFVALRRGPWLTTLLFAASFLSIGAFQFGTLGILHADTPGSAGPWAAYLARSSALASWLWLTLSVILGRSDPWAHIRNAGAYLSLALIGCIAMGIAGGMPIVVSDVTGSGIDATVTLGNMGKIYLMYLVVVMMAVLMNLERMLRAIQASAERRLRPLFLAFLVGILSQMLVVSAALLFDGLQVSWLVMSSAPLFAAGVVTALALARRRLSDLSVPVARPVIYYSSVSLTLAGAFLLTMAVLSRVLPTLPPLWKTFTSLTFFLLVGGGGLLLTLSPRVSRWVKRFIDRNFYANRYDYRREWERVSNAITPTASPEAICRQIESLVTRVFEAERIAVYSRDEPDAPLRREHGPAGLPAVIESANPLVLELERSLMPLVFRQVAHDLDLIPVVVENRELIDAMKAEVCAPLVIGDRMVGLLWLSQKRGDEDYSYEDVEFLAAMSRQLGAAMGFARQADHLAQNRQLESLHRLSTFVLHDIKNHVSGLSLVVENAQKHLANPEFQKDALAVVERTVSSLRELMGQVSGVARPPEVMPEPCDVRELLDQATAASGFLPGKSSGPKLSVRCPIEGPLVLDRGLIHRVLVNLLVNSREAVEDDGRIDLIATYEAAESGRQGFVTFAVVDDGRGMGEAFVRTSLFKPFSTTKAGGLGMGLAQSKSIVDAHGGSISVESRLGEGTTFSVRLPVVRPGATESEDPDAAAVPEPESKGGDGDRSREVVR